MTRPAMRTLGTFFGSTLGSRSVARREAQKWRQLSLDWWAAEHLRGCQARALASGKPANSRTRHAPGLTPAGVFSSGSDGSSRSSQLLTTTLYSPLSPTRRVSLSAATSPAPRPAWAPAAAAVRGITAADTGPQQG